MDPRPDPSTAAPSVRRDLYQPLAAFTLADTARAMGLYPFFHPIAANEGPEALVDGRRVLMFGSNNYLGLTIDPRVREAAAEAVKRYGTSLTGSRLLNGTLEMHRQLEQRLAAFLGKEEAVVVSTGYQANLAAIQALVGKGSALVLDHRVHASLFDASRMADGETYTFRHGDPSHLDRVLGNLSLDQGVLVVLEGVHSMDGDVLALPDYLAVASRHGARVLLDDAHGIGVHGPGGRGTAARFGATDEVDLIVGTFSKSLASVGGFICGPAKVIDYIRHFGRSFVFTAALPPASVAAAAAALERLIAEPALVTRLQDNVARYRQGLASAGFTLIPSDTPVVPIVARDELTTVRLWRDLLDAGLYVNAALWPAVPRGHALLRTSVMAAHTHEHVDAAVAILTGAVRKAGLLG